MYLPCISQVVGMPHMGGLNPRSFRAHGATATSSRELKNLIDGQLVLRFLEASGEEQRRLAMQHLPPSPTTYSVHASGPSHI